MANLSNINNKFLVTTTGEVLIGGTAAIGAAKLQVTGEARIYTGSNLGYWGVDAGNSYVYLGTNSSGYGLSLQTAGTERMRIDSSGNVGIGTDSPSSFVSNGNKLVVGDGTVSQGITIYTSDNGNGTLYFADGTTGDEAYRGFVRYSHSLDSMLFYTAGANERMRIDSDGLVTLASMSSNDTRQLTFMGDSNSTSGNGGAIGMFADETRITSNWYYNSGQQKYVAGNGQAVIGLNTGATDASSFIGFGVNGPAAAAGPTLRMLIDSSGRVGIGVTPSYANAPLHTKNIGGGNSFNIFEGIGNAWVFGENDDTGTKYCQVAGRYGHHSGINVDLSGNVGIGTSSPSAKLDVRTDDGVLIKGASGSANGKLSFLPASGGRQYDFRNDGSSFVIQDASAGTNRMYFHYNGNVGIGTTSPLNKTHIVGPTLATGTETSYGLAVSDVGDQTKTLILGYDLVNDVGIIQAIDQQTAWKNLAFGISGNSKVGIGTTSPTQKLDVAGLVKHQGLDMTAGIQVDQITSITKTLNGALNTWHDTGIYGSDIGANGSYMIQIYNNVQQSGVSNYAMYWTGTMSWYYTGTNSVNTSEIYLNSAGHYRGMDLELRTISNTTGTTNPYMSIQFRSNQTLTNHPNFIFKFRRLM